MTSTQSPAQRLHALPLRWRLSIITAALVCIALMATSAAVVALVRNSLIAQIDQGLQQAAQAPLQLTTSADGPSGSDDRHGPTDYVVAVIRDGTAFVLVESSTQSGKLPDFTQIPVVRQGEYATVASASNNGPTWRLYLYELHNADGETLAVIARSMDSVEETVGDMIKIMVAVGLVVVALVGLAGYLAVQRSLRPLRDIEAAAGAVAAGDLTQRAPMQPPSTEVGRLGRSFNAMVAELEESFAQRQASEARMRRFVSDASHELRTPLASIRGYGELYRMGAVATDDVPATMARIESEATRMGGLVSDLLSLARLDEGRGLRLSDVDLTSVAADGVADLGALDRSRTTTLIADGPVQVRADSDRIRQVVTNLIGNAVQHTPAGSPVELAVAVDGEFAVLEVRDHGPGIAASESARVFERFYRPDTSRTRSSGGSGLGLAIVATIAAAHGGTVRHRPTEGGGATIVLRLPVAGPDAAAAL